MVARYLKLWFGTWLLFQFNPTNSQVQTDSFKRHRYPSAFASNRNFEIFHGNGDHSVIQNSFQSSSNLRPQFIKTDGIFPNRNVRMVIKKKEVDVDQSTHSNNKATSLSDILSSNLLPSSFNSKLHNHNEDLFGKQLNSDNEDEKAQIIGAFAKLPPPSKKNKKLRRTDNNRQPEDTSSIQLPNKILHTTHNRFNTRGNTRNFGDRPQPFLTKNMENRNHRFNSDRRGFNRNTFGNSNDKKSVIGHPIFVTNNDDSVKKQFSGSIRGEGPIIIKRGNSNFDHSPFINLEGNFKRPIRNKEGTKSKFGPVVTIIHGQPGEPDIIIPEDSDLDRPFGQDSSSSFHSNFGQSQVAHVERPLSIRPKPSQNDRSDLNIDVFDSRLQKVKRPTRQPFERDTSITHHDRPKIPGIAFFPDLGVQVDKPRRIQTSIRHRNPSIPDVQFETNNFDSTRGSLPSRDRDPPRRRNQFSLPVSSGNVPSLAGGSQIFTSSNQVGNKQNWPYIVSDSEPQGEYSYGYSVNAPSTGDHKAAFEERKRDGSVRGQYSLLQPDGLYRMVTYNANNFTGFRANVEYLPE